MMNQSENHNEQDEWRNAFKDASEMPPASVWDAIEKHLDSEEENVLPLWWKSRRLWIAAASVAALISVTWLTFPKTGKDNVQVAVQPRSSTESLSEGASSVAAPAGVNEQAGLEKDDLSLGSDGLSKGQGKTSFADGHQIFQPKSGHRKFIQSQQQAANAVAKNGGQGLFERASLTQDPTGPVRNSVAAVLTAVPNERGNNGIGNLNPIPSRGVRELDVFFQRRYVHYQSGANIESEKKQSEGKPEKEKWVALSLMPGAFNPHQEINSPGVSGLFSNSQSPSGQGQDDGNEAKLSLALQTQTGFKLSKHWSLETGLSYLKGNSNFMSNGVLRDLATRTSTNTLEAAYVGATQFNKGQQVNELVSGLAYVDVMQETTNNYHYLQLPLQAGYTVNPEGKVSFVVLGGVAANYFLKNEFGTASGSTHSNTSGNAIYRTLNWAGTTGLRINYDLSSQWNLNLTGSYQQSFQSNFRENSGLKSLPQWYGLGWGVRYSF